jgi:transcriptional/translational regulatory protein YebC/TACO1
VHLDHALRRILGLEDLDDVQNVYSTADPSSVELVN